MRCARTLWVVFSELTGTRGRTFDSAVDGSRAEPMPDAKTVWTRDAMHVCSGTISVELVMLAHSNSRGRCVP